MIWLLVLLLVLLAVAGGIAVSKLLFALLVLQPDEPVSSWRAPTGLDSGEPRCRK